MAAIIDPDILGAAEAQLRGGNAATAPQPARSPMGAIVDPEVEAEIRRQLAAPAVPAVPVAPAAPVSTPTPASAPARVPGETYFEPPPDRGWMGPVDDAVRLFSSGIPFSDRIAAGMATLTGTGLPNADYAKNLANERAKDAWVRSEHPTLAKVLPMAGGTAALVATAPEQVVSAPTMLGKMLWGGGTGAVAGGFQGASDAPDLTNTSDAARRIATGAAVGSTTGAAAPLVGGLIGAGYSGVANTVSGGVDGMSRPVGDQLVRSLAAQGIKPTQEALDRLGPEAMLADTGEAMRAKAQGAAINNPEGRVIVPGALNARDAGTNARLAQDVISALGPTPATPLQIDAHIKALRSWEHDALPQIFENAGPVDASAALATIGQGLTKAVGPEATALGQMRNWLMETRQTPDGTIVKVPVTDPQKLQNAKVAINNLIKYGDKSLGIEPGAIASAQGALKTVSGQINQALRDQVPGYDKVMDTSAALARKADAIETGYNDILGGGKGALHPADLNDRLQKAAKLGPEVAEGYRIGLRAAIDRTMGTNPNDLVALRRQLGDEGDWNRANMNTVLGAGPVGRLAEAVDRNSVFRDTKNQIVNGAKTAWATQALNELKPNAGVDRIPFFNPNATLAGQISTIAAYPFKKAGQIMADQLRSDPFASQGELGRVLVAQGKQRDAYMSALVDALQRRNANAAMGQAIGDRSALAAALIGGRALNDQLQPQPQIAPASR